MKVIYKYKLEGFVVEIELPKYYQALHIDVQGGHIFLWAMIDNQIKEKVKVTFRIFGTGHLVPEDIEKLYLKTVQVGSSVWHIFKDAKDVSIP